VAITAVYDIKGRSGTPYLGTDTSIDVQYIVYTDNARQGEADILAANVLPNRGDVFSENAYLAAYQIKLKREDLNPTIWRATVTFKTDSLDPKEKDKQLYPNPMERPAVVEWDSVSYPVPAATTVEDYTPPGETEAVKAGSPVVNSAWDPFDPPVEKTEYNWTCTVSKFVPEAPTWLLDIPGTVNDGPFTVGGLPIAEGAARITSLRIGSLQRENGYTFVELKFGIEFRRKREPRTTGEVVPDPWILELENMGYNERPVSSYQSMGSQLLRIVDGNNKPVPNPVYLTADGYEATSVTPTTSVKRHFKIYRTSDFSQLPLT